MAYLTVKPMGGNHGHRIKDYIGGCTIAKLFDLTYLHTPDPTIEFAAIGYGEPLVSSINSTLQQVRVHETKAGGMDYATARARFERYAPLYTHTFEPSDNLFLKPVKSSRIGDDYSTTLLVLSKMTRIFPHQCIQWHRFGLIEKDIFTDVHHSLSRKYQTKHHHFTNIHHTNPTYHVYLPPLSVLPYINVAVHISRGIDYNRTKFPQHFASPQYPRYMFPLDYFNTIFRQIREACHPHPCCFTIYTEKLNSEEIVNNAKLQNYQLPHADMFVQVGPNRTRELTSTPQFEQTIASIFDAFVTADILVTCNSSFSAMAAYYRRDRPTIYHEHLHLHSLPAPEDGGSFYKTSVKGEFYWEKLREWVARKGEI